MKDHLFIISEEGLRNSLLRVRTLSERVPIYQGARITFDFVDPNEIQPISKYVLRSNLLKIQAIRESVKNAASIDIYKDAVAIKGVVRSSRLTLSVPIVETVEEEGGYQEEIIDGIHRAFDARQRGERILVAKISGVRSDYPPIGLPVSWENVKVVEVQPARAEDCRNLRPGIPDEPQFLRKYYRDFSHFGSNGRRPRPEQVDSERRISTQGNWAYQVG